jgi:hypothetical protein
VNRPMPPEDIGTIIKDHPVSVMPALDMPEWALATFMHPDSRLYNADHFHLYDALEQQSIGVLWVSGSYFKQGNQIIGLTEQVAFRSGFWSRLRQEQQLMEWFGMEIPDFLITLDATYCSKCSDLEFCMLVEHELYHIAQETDWQGAPKFIKETGYPKLAIRGHDVEEFSGVVRRYGVGNPDGRLAQLVKAANKTPEIAHIDIARACGTCLRLAA